MTLEEMGELLRQERERKGIELEKAAVEMKISKKYLVALEEGRTDDLPHPVYAKGFVKNYARLLGLDPEEMGRVLSNHYAVEDDHAREVPRKAPQPKERKPARTTEPGPAAREPEAAPAGGKADSKAEEDEAARKKEPAAPPVKERKPVFVPQAKGRVASQTFAPRHAGFKPSLWLAVPLLAVFAAVAWFFFSSFAHKPGMEGLLDALKSRMETKATNVGKTAGPEPANQEPAQSEPAGGRKATEAAGKPAAKADSGEPAPAAVAQPENAAPVQRDLLAVTPGPGGAKSAPSRGEAGQTPPGEAANPESMAAEAQFASSGKQTLEINADQPASLEVTTEDGQTRSLTLVKGQRLSLRFNDKVAVRFGKAPSVSLKLNGKDYPLEGGKADGKSLTFP